MSHDLRDPLDLQIDEVLADMMAGEPRRVNPASVRAAIEAAPRSAFRVGPWLALAAVLVLAFTFAIRTRTGPPSPSLDTARVLSTLSRPVAEGSVPSPGPETALAAAATFVAIEPSVARRRAIAAVQVREDPPPFPRLDITSIDRPEPLVPGALEAGALHLKRIDIAPLQVTDLNQQPEPRP